MVLVTMAIFAITALSYDAGVWYFDHRTAQNQAEAAALAAALELPARGTMTDAEAQANAIAQADDYLVKNGSEATSAGGCPANDDNSHIQFEDLTGDGKMDAVTVCVRRQSPSAFAKLSGINIVHISASAKARSGPVDSTNVLPWAIVPPDPTCTEDAGRNCLYDAAGDGDYIDPGDCDDEWLVCPFGLTDDRLYTFKSGGGGNTGIIESCGASGASDYKDCLQGFDNQGNPVYSGFYTVGTTVSTGLQGGNLGINTNAGLQARQPSSAWAAPNICDVDSFPSKGSVAGGTPDPTYPESPGYDPLGWAAAQAKFVDNEDNPECAYRLVPIPIVASLPAQGGGSTDLVVLGVATFGVAKWNTVDNKDFWGTSTEDCRSLQNNEINNQYACGIVWGYLFSGVTPPDALLNQIGSSNNPFAPLLIALVD